MQLQILPQTFAVCQIQDTSQINWQMPLFFFSKTAEELSLVCPETDLHETEAQFCLILRGFLSILLFVHQFLNPRFCRLLSDFNPNLFLMCRLLC